MVHLINGTPTPIDDADLRRLAARVLRAVGAPRGEVSIRFCGDVLCRRYNREFLGRDRPTDVIAWPSGQSRYLGDILVNLAQARRQARRWRVSFAEEVRRLVAHGLLHLAGYDHTRDQGEMERLQEQLVRKR